MSFPRVSPFHRYNQSRWSLSYIQDIAVSFRNPLYSVQVHFIHDKATTVDQNIVYSSFIKYMLSRWRFTGKCNETRSAWPDLGPRLVDQACREAHGSEGRSCVHDPWLGALLPHSPPFQRSSFIPKRHAHTRIKSLRKFTFNPYSVKTVGSGHPWTASQKTVCPKL